MTDRELLCKRFTELTGGHWHEEVIYLAESNPSFQNPADVLRVMFSIEPKIISKNFVDRYGQWFDDIEQKGHKIREISIPYFSSKMIIEPDALLKAAIEFLEERKEK